MVDSLKLEAMQLALIKLYTEPLDEDNHAFVMEREQQLGTTHNLAVRNTLGSAMQRLFTDLSIHVNLLGAGPSQKIAHWISIKHPAIFV